MYNVIEHSVNMALYKCYILLLLGVRSLANASRVRQFNPPKPPWGGVYNIHWYGIT